MRTHSPTTESMKDAMKRALSQSNHSTPSALSALFDLLREAQDALREGGYVDAVLELRSGLQTDYGLRYTAYLRDTASTFESQLFSVFVDENDCAFQAEGQLRKNLDAEGIRTEARNYLLRRSVVEYMTGLLRQFGQRESVPSLEIPSVA